MYSRQKYPGLLPFCSQVNNLKNQFTAAVPSADSSQLDPLKLESHHPQPQRESRLRPTLAVGCLAGQTWADPGCRASREEESVPSACTPYSLVQTARGEVVAELQARTEMGAEI